MILDRNDEARERDILRMERHKERARERNLARAAPDKRYSNFITLYFYFIGILNFLVTCYGIIHRNKLQKERERDISEQIALGLPAKTIMGGEGQFDQRLFDGSKGMDSGFGDDEAYNVYDKPWRSESTMSQNIYKHRNLERETNHIGERSQATGHRSGPVQYERAEEDPFGLDQFLTQAKRATKRPRDEKGGRDEKRSKRRD